MKKMSAAARAYEMVTEKGDSHEATLVQEPHRRRKTVRVDVELSMPKVYIGPFDDSRKLFRVKTIAERGAAFYSSEPGLAPRIVKAGQPHPTTLLVGETRIPVLSRPLYDAGEWVGIEFVGTARSTGIAIKTHFFLEFIAASFQPTLVNPQLVSFTCKEGHKLTVKVDQGEVVEFDLDLGLVWHSVKWRKGDALTVLLATPGRVTDEEIRAHLYSFARNLPGLNTRVARSVEQMVRTGKIEFVDP